MQSQKPEKKTIIRPHMVTSHIIKLYQDVAHKGNLYLSGVGSLNDHDNLKSNHIDCVLTIIDPWAYSHFKVEQKIAHMAIKTHKWIDLQDQQCVQILPQFEPALSYIRQNLKTTNVLVHCQMGISRSASIVIAFLMKQIGMSMLQALTHVKSKRMIVDPNSNFRKNLSKKKNKQELQRTPRHDQGNQQLITIFDIAIFKPAELSIQAQKSLVLKQSYHHFILSKSQQQNQLVQEGMISTKNQLMNIFDEPTYAWELLEWEIAIEMNESLSGQAIAKLLELYMRGVQKMNSLMDIREAYFKNKVQSLMMKNSVVKTLNKPPMAKKQKPLQVSAKVQQKKVIKTKNQKANEKKEDNLTSVIQQKPVISTFALQQKKREIQMRLAYEAHESSRQNLNNIYNQHITKEEKFTTKVKNILNDHQQRLKQRITRRKLRTATYRSRPEDQADAFPAEENSAQRKQQEQFLSPSQERKAITNKKQERKRHSSMQNKVSHELTIIVESPRKYRNSFYIENTVRLFDEPQVEAKQQQKKQQKLEMLENVVLQKIEQSPQLQ